MEQDLTYSTTHCPQTNAFQQSLIPTSPHHSNSTLNSLYFSTFHQEYSPPTTTSLQTYTIKPKPTGPLKASSDILRLPTTPCNDIEKRSEMHLDGKTEYHILPSEVIAIWGKEQCRLIITEEILARNPEVVFIIGETFHNLHRKFIDTLAHYLRDTHPTSTESEITTPTKIRLHIDYGFKFSYRQSNDAAPKMIPIPYCSFEINEPVLKNLFTLFDKVIIPKLSCTVDQVSEEEIRLNFHTPVNMLDDTMLSILIELDNYIRHYLQLKNPRLVDLTLIDIKAFVVLVEFAYKNHLYTFFKDLFFTYQTMKISCLFREIQTSPFILNREVIFLVLSRVLQLIRIESLTPPSTLFPEPKNEYQSLLYLFYQECAGFLLLKHFDIGAPNINPNTQNKKVFNLSPEFISFVSSVPLNSCAFVLNDDVRISLEDVQNSFPRGYSQMLSTSMPRLQILFPEFYFTFSGPLCFSYLNQNPVFFELLKANRLRFNAAQDIVYDFDQNKDTLIQAILHNPDLEKLSLFIIYKYSKENISKLQNLLIQLRNLTEAEYRQKPLKYLNVQRMIKSEKGIKIEPLLKIANASSEFEKDPLIFN